MLTGARPDDPDSNDSQYALEPISGNFMVPREVMPAPEITRWIMDQSIESSCVAHAVCLAWRMMNGIIVSRRHIMIEAQALDRWKSTAPDRWDGTSLRAALKAGQKLGFCEDHILPYKPGKRLEQINFDSRTLEQMLVSQIENRIEVYRAVKLEERHIKAAIANYKCCLITARVPLDFDKHRGYLVRLGPVEKSDQWHSFLLVGYDNDNLIMANSWGSRWGDRGFAGWRAEQLLERAVSAWVFQV